MLISCKMPKFKIETSQGDTFEFSNKNDAMFAFGDCIRINKYSAKLTDLDTNEVIREFILSNFGPGRSWER